MIKYTDYLKCIKCVGDLSCRNNVLICEKCNQKYQIIDNNIVKMMPKLSEDLQLSVEKWDEFYHKQIDNKSYQKEYNFYKKRHLEDIKRQLPVKSGSYGVYLEIGCGPLFLGQNLTEKYSVIMGIDFCLSALKIAKKMLDEAGVKDYLLVQGDVLSLPFKNDLVDFLYGGGVIEHFNDTQRCVNEIHRVLKPKGITFNTVPYLNIGSLTYRQVWGNIPNAPVIKQLAEFVHIKLLGGRHMIFGYEMSFLASTLRKVHQKAGFKKIKVEKFEVEMSFDFAPKKLHGLFTWLAKNSRLFWPMVKVIGEK